MRSKPAAPPAERAALRVLDALGVVDVKDLEHVDRIAWARGATVVYEPLRGAEARLLHVGRKAVITVSMAVTNPGRKRFAVVHELGHFEMHRLENNLSVCTAEDLEDWRSQHVSRELELQANEFAAALLLPAPFFARPCDVRRPSLEVIADLAETFKTSLTATALRFVQFSPAPCAVVYSKDGFTKWFRGSQEFEELGLFVDVRSKVDPSTLAYRFFDGKSIPDKQRSVAASAWLRSGRYRSDATLREHSLAMPQQNAVLTFLWVDGDIEEEPSDGDENR